MPVHSVFVVTERFTENFISYAKEFTDCPDSFLLWGALLAISSSLTRALQVEIGSWNIAPHIWIILIGRSSSHKSMALSIVEDLLSAVEPERAAPHEFTSEAIIEALAKNPNRLFIFDEAKAFFDMVEKKYNESLKSLFTILYRKPFYSRQTKKGGFVQIKNAYMTVGMATTLEWLRQSIQDAEQSAMSGFLARFLMVSYNGDGNKPMPLPPPHNIDKFEALTNQLRSYQKIAQVFHYTPDAQKKLVSWYEHITARENVALPILGPFFEHLKNEAIHKMGMLFAIDRGELEITASAFEEACICLGYLEKILPHLVSDITEQRIDRDRRKIADYIKTNTDCTREKLAFSVHVHGENLSRHLSGLQEDGLISISKMKGATKPITVLQWVGSE